MRIARGDKISEYEIVPEDFGIAKRNVEALRADSVGDEFGPVFKLR